MYNPYSYIVVSIVSSLSQNNPNITLIALRTQPGLVVSKEERVTGTVCCWQPAVVVHAGLGSVSMRKARVKNVTCKVQKFEPTYIGNLQEQCYC